MIRAEEFSRQLREWMEAPKGTPFSFVKEEAEAREAEEEEGKSEED